MSLLETKVRKLLQSPMMPVDYQSRLNADFPLTEFGNAARMVQLCGSELTYVPEDNSWYLWTGVYWQRTTEANVRKMAANVVKEMSRTIPNGLDSAALVAYHKWCVQSQKASMVSSMVSLVANDPTVLVPFNQLDRDRNFLGVANGAVNLTTGTLQNPNRSDYLTITTGVAFNATATCPLFEQTVSDAFYGDADMVAFFQRVVGYSLMGNPKEHVIVIPYGSGSNGKSTILNAISAVLGGHAKCTSASTFLTDGRGFSGNASGPNEAVLRLRGSRFVAMSEPDEGSQLREGLIKSVTGGDTISARGVHAKHSVEFQPSWVTFMATNHRPIVKGVDHAIWRRLLLVPFTRNFSADAAIPKDPDRAEKLKTEYEGILRWCVDGALAYQRAGLGLPDSVRAAHLAYKVAMDLLGDWLAEEWEDDPNGYATTEELWASWKRHGEHFGTIEMVRTVNALSRSLVDRGYTNVRRVPGAGKRGFRGIRRRTFENRDFLD
ncbi:phage/plasmid primase, P4 family [Paraburkholderia kirstenboschensis]|uniref:DNA primase family protein n=1 Tax=Paraburkholderia kirstenboschensis TaxID=1245436 RepID=UPI0013E2A863|nr:phage/plasmid primase, P4 family [Paraburkholderia kirstenboschensis]